VAALAIGQWGVGLAVEAGNVGRVAGVYYSPTHLALYLERVWPLAMVLASYGGLQHVRKHWRWLAWGSVVVLTVGLYLSYSRAAWLLALPVALAVVGVSYRRRLRWATVAVAVLGVGLAAVSVLVGRGTPPSGLVDEIRVPLWESTVAAIEDHRWTGVGLDGFRFVYPRYMQREAWTEPLLYHPHNMWLDAAVRLGIPGLALFGLLVVASVVSAAAAALHWRRKATEEGVTPAGANRAVLMRAVAVGCTASLAAGLAHGLVDSGYFLVDLAWCLALVAGTVVVPKNPGVEARHRVTRSVAR
jgi:O-antigen ligase